MRRFALVLAAAAALPGCARHARSAAPSGAVVAERRGAETRLVLAAGEERRLLSAGLRDAGEPAVSPDGRRVVFSARAGARDPLEIWEAALDGGAPRPLTREACGARGPALLPDGTLVFAAPAEGASSLFTLSPGADAPKPFTFVPARDPFVLADGRVLFVSRQPGEERDALFAANDDGTGVTAYAANHDGAPLLARPREEGDRVVFTAFDLPGAPARRESVLQARPWKSRGPFAASAPAVPPASGWEVVEELPLAPRRVAGRRLSTVDPSKRTGILLCLDADRTDRAQGHAARLRVTAATPRGAVPLGEVVPAADGSFVAEVPADLPLGFEALDEAGKVLRAVPPFVWVRPGETRGCIGCHEPHGMAPRNHRPLAVWSSSAKLTLPGGGA